MRIWPIITFSIYDLTKLKLCLFLFKREELLFLMINQVRSAVAIVPSMKRVKKKKKKERKIRG